MRSTVRRSASITAVALAAGLVIGAAPSPAGAGARAPVVDFDPVTRYTVSGAVAEIVAATPDGGTLVYTDSETAEIGFVDITDPALPTELGTLAMGGSPTSVAVTPDGDFALVAVSNTNELVVVDVATRTAVHSIALGGQPDAVVVNKSGRYAAIAIENERNEDVDGGAMPQDPAGLLTIVDLVGDPDEWTTRDVALTGIADRFPTDPEPEFIDIRAGIAAVTLQENNHIVLVRLSSGAIVADFSAGTTTHAADLTDNATVSFTETLTDARREPDGIAWTPLGRLTTANEGDYDVDLTPGQFVGGRNFTVFGRGGGVRWERGANLERKANLAGLYPDSRSDAKGVEPEGVEVARFGGRTFAFIGAERGDFVAVYRLVGPEEAPLFVEILPTGARPEGLLAIPARGLFVSANEDDGTIDVFAADT
ncbi:MAG: hypothetical protein JNK12_08615 [Acidimicrobiales bacterium]|nr:hypothetical protein [Acidimicrobiales bacterium]